MMNDIPLALYVHLPWCVRKCPYCDFNSHAAKGELPETAYVAALIADLDQDFAACGAARPLASRCGARPLRMPAGAGSHPRSESRHRRAGAL
jgi:hypothetical protein